MENCIRAVCWMQARAFSAVGSEQNLSQQSTKSHHSIEWKKHLGKLHSRYISRARRPDQTPKVAQLVGAPLAELQNQAEVFGGFKIVGVTSPETFGKFCANCGGALT